jgi:hypothetical protein
MTKPLYVRLSRIEDSPFSGYEKFEWLFGESETECTRAIVSKEEVLEWLEKLGGEDDYIELVNGNFKANRASRARLAEYLEMILEGTEI